MTNREMPTRKRLLYILTFVSLSLSTSREQCFDGSE